MSAMPHFYAFGPNGHGERHPLSRMALVDDECPHEKLPTDRVQTCDCWGAS